MKLRYKRSTLGLAWSMLNPLLQFAVFYLVFRFILPVGRENYGLFLFIGLLAWGWFQTSLQIGCSAIVDHASLIRQPGFAPATLPLATVLSSLLHFLIALPIVFTATAVAGKLSVALILGLPIVVLRPVPTHAEHRICSSRTPCILSGRPVFAVHHPAAWLLSFSCSVCRLSDVPARFRWLYDLNPLVPTTRELSQYGGRRPDAEPCAIAGWWVLVPASHPRPITHRLFLKSKPLVR